MNRISTIILSVFGFTFLCYGAPTYSQEVGTNVDNRGKLEEGKPLPVMLVNRVDLTVVHVREGVLFAEARENFVAIAKPMELAKPLVKLEAAETEVITCTNSFVWVVRLKNRHEIVLVGVWVSSDGEDPAQRLNLLVSDGKAGSIVASDFTEAAAVGRKRQEEEFHAILTTHGARLLECKALVTKVFKK